jgi:MarR-like DNA-binding transcriptional regulator SgrR of sgrS sRNA
MKRFSSILLASSLLPLAITARAEQRPHYGGALRIAVKQAPPALDSFSSGATVSSQVFETLVRLDERGRPQPLLATAWQPEPGNQRWRISLRSGVSFHDGTPLDAAAVAASLRSSNPDWKVVTTANAVIIETPSPAPDLPAELALARNAIVRKAGAQLAGTGQFSVADFTPGKHLTLRANERYWAGRPFIDSIELAFGGTDREQMLALDLGKADLIEVAAESIRRARAEGRTLASSEPAELMALAFASDPRSDDEIHARNALAASLDLTALADVVLQGGGDPAAGLLPNWLSGYEFAFPTGRRVDLARQERAQVRQVPPLTLSYDPADPVARVVADRVLLNARDAGITLQLVPSGPADVSVVRAPLESSDPHVALTELARAFQLSPPRFSSDSVEELYAAEKTLLQSHRFIPLVHLRSSAASRANMRGLAITTTGEWNLSNVWLAAEKP